jgi:hypothetical protein
LPDGGGTTPQVFGFEVVGPAMCAVDSDCAPLGLCDAQTMMCRPEPIPCAIDRDCPEGFGCDTFHGGVCEIKLRSCSSDFSCLVGEVCDLDLGLCMGRPVCQTLMSPSCPTGFSCDATTSYCQRQCSQDSDCGPGERCKSTGCVAQTPCTTDAECPSSTCDTTIDACRGGGALCAACESDADCGGQFDTCVDGFCGQDCRAGQSACPTGFDCEQGLSPPQCVPSKGNRCTP